MSDLICITYSDETKAEQMREKIFALQKEYLIELADAVIAVKKPDGQIKLNQLLNTTAVGALSGGFWGTVIGMIFLMPLAGAALGAASGALSGAFTDYGINDDLMREIAGAIQPGNAALFLLVRKMTEDKVLQAIHGSGGVVLKTSLDQTKERALREAIASAPHAGMAEEPPTPMA